MNTNLRPVTVIVADDHPLIRDSFRFAFTKTPGYRLAGEAANGEELIRLTEIVKPDIIITDIAMPVMNGIDATRHITKQFPCIKVIALSMLDEESSIIDMLEAGAKGYLLKSADINEICYAVQQVLHGKMYFCKEATQNLTRKQVQSSNEKQKVRVVLTEQEKNIVKLICKGYSNKEISKHLFLSTRTIEWHRAKILFKLDSKNSAAMVEYGIKNNLC
jgi:two-component system response regulator NreC